MMSKEDKVNHPSHYTWLKKLCGIEVIDITRHLNFNLGNVVKYVLRAGHKSEQGMSDRQKQIEDLKKARLYIGDEIRRLEKDEELDAEGLVLKTTCGLGFRNGEEVITKIKHCDFEKFKAVYGDNPNPERPDNPNYK